MTMTIMEKKVMTIMTKKVMMMMKKVMMTKKAMMTMTTTQDTTMEPMILIFGSIQTELPVSYTHLTLPTILLV